MKVITGKVRFSYANVWQPKSINGSEPKYSVSIIIPKTDDDTIKKIKEAIGIVKKESKLKLGESDSENIKTPLHDGDVDVDRQDHKAYENSYFINANSITKPGIVDRNVAPILDESKFYSGCYGRASVTFYAYNTSGNKGIACGLQNIQKLEDGEVLSGHSTPEDDFDVVEVEGDFLD